jgi:hypothetical protein
MKILHIKNNPADARLLTITIAEVECISAALQCLTQTLFEIIQGLKDEHAHFSECLYAVVNVWITLSSDRPYLAAWPSDKTLAFITEQARTL